MTSPVTVFRGHGGRIFAADMAEGSPIVWITGQPEREIDLGSGSVNSARPSRRCSWWIGDDLRGTHRQCRLQPGRPQANIRRAQNIALYLSRQGQVVIVAVVAPFRELREGFKARANVKEIFVHTTEVRGREHFHSEEYGAPESDFLDVDTTGRSISRGGRYQSARLPTFEFHRRRVRISRIPSRAVGDTWPRPSLGA